MIPSSTLRDADANYVLPPIVTKRLLPLNIPQSLSNLRRRPNQSSLAIRKAVNLSWEINTITTAIGNPSKKTRISQQKRGNFKDFTMRLGSVLKNVN